MLWHPSRVCFVEPRPFSATNDHGRLLGRLYCEDRYHGRSMLQLCEIDIGRPGRIGNCFLAFLFLLCKKQRIVDLLPVFSCHSSPISIWNVIIICQIYRNFMFLFSPEEFCWKKFTYLFDHCVSLESEANWIGKIGVNLFANVPTIDNIKVSKTEEMNLWY